jgi:hypothetical protein
MLRQRRQFPVARKIRTAILQAAAARAQAEAGPTPVRRAQAQRAKELRLYE